METLLNEFDDKINIEINHKKTTPKAKKTETQEKVNPKKVEKDKTEKINKGTGAGGSKTNKSGKTYEKKVDCTNYLISNGFELINKNKNIYLIKSINNLEILFFQQRELNKYLEKKYNKQIYRIPDQSILIIAKEKKPKLIIIEIKNQNVSGSVDEKLWAGVAIKKNYQYWLEDFDIEYVFILSSFLYNLVIENKKKYNGLKKIFDAENIEIFNGDDVNNSENIHNLIINNN